MIQSDQDIRRRLDAVRLPAMPQILLKLLELCQADGAGMAEMAKLIANDAGMTVKILNVANSAAYNRGGQKAGLLQALNVLGSDMIKTLVISESVFQAFSGFAGSAQTDLRRFWKHALGTAVIAREIAKAMDYAQSEEAYLAGLLHDVGRLALLAAAPDDYLVNFQAEDDHALCAAELRTLHTTHVEAGAWVVERWSLDSFLADAILYHHEPVARLEGAHPLIRVVHLAHQLSAHDPAQPVAADMGALCSIPVESLQTLCQGASVQVQKAAGYLGVDLAGVDDLVALTAVAPPAPKPSAAQQKLSEEVRNMTLLNELDQTLSRQKDDLQLLKVVRQQAQILFDLDVTAVFLMDGSGRALLGASVAEQHQRLVDFSLNLSAGGTLADSVTHKRLTFLERQSGVLSLVEEQLLRIFGTGQVLCVPMLHGDKCLGVLLGAVPPRLLEDLRQRESFLLAFAARSAKALQAMTRAAAPSRIEPGAAAGAEEALAIDQRIAAIQQEHRDRARRVVHEVNNPLAIIKNYLEVLDDKLTRQEPVQGEIGVLHEEIARIGNIMGELVGATPAQQQDTVELNQTVNKVVRLLRESKFLPPSLELVVDLPAQNCDILGSADTVKQILVNLIKNSVEALPKGGRIEIVNNGQVQRNGRYFYALCVSDNGPGIPTEHRSKLFSPVQSSKAGSNRGIGLSIVQGLVKQLGGTIACVSTTTMGTMFEVCLPVPQGMQVQPAFSASAQDIA